MKKWIPIILICISVLFLNGCSQNSKEDFLKELKPQESKYKIHLFYSERESAQIEMDELNEFINSDQRITKNFFEAEGHNYSEELKGKLNTLDIDYFPVYLLVDSEGVKLQTQYLSKVKDYINNELGL